jgi:hypothetical protein
MKRNLRIRRICLLTSLTVMVVAWSALAEGTPTVRKVNLSGLEISLSLPSEFQPSATSDPKRSALFQAPEWSANVLVLVLPGENFSEQDLADPETLERIRAVTMKDGGKLLSHQMVTLPAKRKALKTLLDLPGKASRMRQLRYLIASDPGVTIMFTTSAEQAPKLIPKAESWIQTLRI